MKLESKKNGFMNNYKTYNPEVEGFGSPSQWRKAFNKRMSLDEAKNHVKDQNPFDILEVANSSDWDTVKKAFRKIAMKWHPDKNPGNEKEANEKMQKILAAYTVIKNILGK